MRFSVVINTYNRSHSLRTTLAALEHQTYRDFEVVVVNGPSTDGTEQLLESWAGKIVHARCPEVNISMSRNVGINHASGDIIAYIDDDAIPEANWIEQLAAAYTEERIGGVGGLVWDHTGMQLQYRFSLCDYLGRTEFVDDQPDYRSISKHDSQFVYLQGTNSSFRRSVLEEIQGFDEEIEYFHDETDLAARITDAGYMLVPLDCAAVHHKYLASHLRTKERTVLEPYPIVKNSHYFGLMLGNRRFSAEEIAAHLEKYTEDVYAHGVHSVAAGTMSEEQHAYFQRRVKEGREEGVRRGESGIRKLGNIVPSRPGDFKPFPTKVPQTKRVRVCFVSNEYPPDEFGGIGRFTRDLAEEMAGDGHQVHVITKSGDADRIDWENGVWMHRLCTETSRVQMPELQNVDYRWNLAHCATVYAEVKRLNTMHPLDAVSSPLWASEGLFCALDDELPSVLTLMTTQKTLGKLDPSLGKQQLWQQQVALERQSFRNAKNLHAISEAILQKTGADHGPTGAKAKVSYLGVRDESAGYSRQRTSENLRILYVGRLEPRKGSDLLLEAAARLCRQVEGIEFVLVGKDSGDTTCESYESKFADQHPDLAANGRITFTGAVPDEELYQHYADADAFVLPSRFESFGLVLLEAMSFSLPVVAANIGGMCEIVKDQENGYLFEAENETALFDCLAKLVADRERLSEMAATARSCYESSWTISRAANATATYYGEIGADHRRQAEYRDYEPSHVSVAERICALFQAEEKLLPLPKNTVEQLLKPGLSTQLLFEVRRIWFRSRKKFIAKAFRAILRRPADEATITYFTNRMEAGATRKEVLQEIAGSAEAKKAGVDTDWLDGLPQTDSVEKRPFLFPLVSAAVRVTELLDRDGPIRTELRRNRLKRKSQRSEKRAA